LLALAYVKSGEDALALESAPQALQRDPGHPYARALHKRLVES